jgi:2-C-methyl-D-erythritol 4-phosphate cytidylyltransferase/2-C-methyl-D-erythritol 2,4-cyclodiphosphate synthase
MYMITAPVATTEASQVRVGVVIPAAGQARRFGSAENKIWAVIAGQTVLERTLTAFNSHPGVSAIVISAGADDIARVRTAAAEFNRVTAVVTGGNTRTDSVRNGLNALPADIGVVLVHDAARPLVSAQLIDRIIASTLAHGAAVPGLPLSDTVKRADSNGIVKTTIPRNALCNGEALTELTAVQTPQGARVDVLRSAYASVDPSAHEITDEASLIEANGGTVAITLGDPINIKVTRLEDVALAERLLGTREQRTGFGYDVHAFAAPEAGRTLFLGGVAIPHECGLEGHSDADVVLHAICDALLGAASLGDIGILFPNTDDSYKGISSLKLLSVVGSRLNDAGWSIVNVDATAVAESPKLMPHRDAMLKAISGELGIAQDRVSVKATTSERMGFVGRREGIACWAVATIQSMQAASG